MTFRYSPKFYYQIALFITWFNKQCKLINYNLIYKSKN